MNVPSSPRGRATPVAAVVAAAGRSTRMGTPKQLLPWRDSTPTGTVLACGLANLAAAGVHPVVCVVGHARDEIERVAQAVRAEVVYNPDYARVEMLASYQAGIRHLLESGNAAADVALTGTLLALGDQPHIPVRVIRHVVQHALRHPDAIVIPSFNMRRGHPMYIPVGLWSDLLALTVEQSMRDLLARYEARIEYVDVDVDAILRDMDTPEEYETLRASAL